MARILVVDDDEAVCSAFSRFLADEGHSASTASNAEDALRAVQEARPDLVIMDIRMPGTDGLAALQRMRALAPDLYVIVITGYGTSQTSIEAARLGAFEYLMKPLDLDVVRATIDKALAERAMTPQAAPEAVEEYPLVNLVGKSAPMQEAYKLIGLLATNDVPALIVGEPRVGKELAARTIHFNSHRKNEPFLAVHCAELPEAVLGEEIFGGAAGATGKLETAAGGTLFLDDVDVLPLPLGARLSRAVAERTIEKGRGELIVDTRILAATEEDLEEEVRAGRFNAALYEALRVITLRLPPLRERRDDIPDLVAYFIGRFNVELRKTIKGVDPRVTPLLLDYRWPGNVGQLRDVIKRACVLARGDVITTDEIAGSLEARAPSPEEADASLDAAVRRALLQRLQGTPSSDTWPPFHDIIGRAEKVLVREALAMTSGNQVRAAELLGLNRTTLRKKIALYHL